MSPRLSRLCAALLVGLLGLSHANACIEIEPRHIVEFEPGSAAIPPDQMLKLMQMLDHSRHLPGRQVSVRGFADTGTDSDAKTWKAEDLALADARARALSEVVRRFGGANCVERVAIGHKPGDGPADRVDADGRQRVSRGVIVISKEERTEPAPEGIRIETDCGPPKPEPVPNPATT